MRELQATSSLLTYFIFTEHSCPFKPIPREGWVRQGSLKFLLLTWSGGELFAGSPWHWRSGRLPGGVSGWGQL